MDTIEQMVDIQTADGPMATPMSRSADGGAHPAVIVIQEVFGVNPNIEGIVQRFAQEGYIAAAPDLYHRAGRLRSIPYDKLQEMRDELRAGGYGDASIDMDVQATIDYLRRDRHRGLLPRRACLDAVRDTREGTLGGGRLLQRIHVPRQRPAGGVLRAARG